MVFLRKCFRSNTPEGVAKEITERIAQSSFKILNDKKFCQLVDFEKLEQDYKIIRKKLGEWSQELLKKQEIVVLSKVDTMDEKSAKIITEILQEEIKKQVLAISAVSGKGIKQFLDIFSRSCYNNYT